MDDTQMTASKLMKENDFKIIVSAIKIMHQYSF